jgi:hypothetical protein
MRRLVAASLLVLAGLLGGAPAAQADDTVCAGTFTGVADNIIVLSGTECILEGAQVRGNALAQPASGLFVGPGSRIGGNVEAKEDAATGSFEATIGGNYKCDNCFFEDVDATFVGGNVEIVGADDGDFITASTIRGNVEIVGSLAGNFAFVIAENAIGGNVKFEKNVGPTAIVENTIAGNLQIFENNVAGAFCPPPPEPPPPGGCPVFQNGLVVANEVDGNLQFFKNRGPSEILGNTIAQNLQCKENVPPPVSAGNVARKREGQCRA